MSRNTIEYPVTADEALEALKEATELHNQKYEGLIGSINPYALYLAKQFIEENKDQFDRFSRRP